MARGGPAGGVLVPPGTVVPPVVPGQPVPAVIDAFTSLGAVVADGLPHTVTITVTATNPNDPATLMSYAFSTLSKGVFFSCGICTASAGFSPVSITATITTKSTAPIIIDTAVANGVLPDAVATLTIVPEAVAVAPKPPIVTKQAGVLAGATVTLSAIAKANNNTSPITISFLQTGGPAVELLLNPTTGLAPNQSATATFVVPVNTAGQTFTFVAVATDPASGLTTNSGTITVKTQ
ncbi:hypothetical protein [Ramlibacter sp.]|uniref:hypothetical protein n=1 Tax=Ramlibacter sp. TaxID=1917967 RepID=UPI00261936CB|nr:hypothetical protein [Ramlibacter sp.]